MKKVIFALWIVPVVLIVFIAFGANKTRRNPNAPRFSPLMRPMKPMSYSDPFGVKGGAGLIFNEQAKKMSYQNALAIISAMNNIADAFYRDYSFAELDRPQFLFALTTFLGNSQHQLILKQFSQILKDNIADFPTELSGIAEGAEQSINNKNAEQFFAVYSVLERYFRGLRVQSLVRIRKPDWSAIFRNIKDAIVSRAQRAYDYLFSRKSA